MAPTIIPTDEGVNRKPDCYRLFSNRLVAIESVILNARRINS